MNRTQIINNLIKEKGYESYLEIGLGNLNNFFKVQCVTKVGIDPFLPENNSYDDVYRLDSDYFFTYNEDKFDLIFIDGLHHSDQVEKDIVNAWKVLNKGGTILIHDIRPFDEKSQRVPRETTAWMGDVWRAWHGLKKTYPKLKTSFIEERAGIGCLQKSRHKIELGFVDTETSYEKYNELKGWK